MGESGLQGCLVWRITSVVDEITAHPPNFTQFLILLSVGGLEMVVRDETTVKFVFVRQVWVRVQGCTDGHGLKDGFHCKIGLRNRITGVTKI